MTLETELIRTRPNLYRTLCSHAAHTTATAVGALTTNGPHPLDTALVTLQAAWVSPSTQRDRFEQDLLDASRRLLTAFTDLEDDLDQAVTREPLTVDLDNPTEAWKARIDPGRSPVY